MRMIDAIGIVAKAFALLGGFLAAAFLVIGVVAYDEGSARRCHEQSGQFFMALGAAPICVKYDALIDMRAP